MSELITQPVFVFMLILAYGSFFVAFYKAKQGSKSVGLYVFSAFWLIISSIASVPAENQFMGLVNIPIAIIAAALALAEAPDAIWE